jgi:hypothetical protein
MQCFLLRLLLGSTHPCPSDTPCIVICIVLFTIFPCFSLCSLYRKASLVYTTMTSWETAGWSPRQLVYSELCAYVFIQTEFLLFQIALLIKTREKNWSPFWACHRRKAIRVENLRRYK